MPMLHNGLAKLSEESGELLQVAGKMLQYPLLQTSGNMTHPDGTNLRERLQEEMGDLKAAIDFVGGKLELDSQAVTDRWAAKLKLFKQWDSEP